MIVLIAIWIAVAYGSAVAALITIGIAIWIADAITARVRRRRAERAWAAGAAWTMHVLDVQALFRDRDGITLADFDAWAEELSSEEAP